MEINRRSLVLLALGFALGFGAAFATLNRYQFSIETDGVWRCDRWTGKVVTAGASSTSWIPVPNPPKME